MVAPSAPYSGVDRQSLNAATFRPCFSTIPMNFKGIGGGGGSGGGPGGGPGFVTGGRLRVGWWRWRRLRLKPERIALHSLSTRTLGAQRVEPNAQVGRIDGRTIPPLLGSPCLIRRRHRGRGRTRRPHPVRHQQHDREAECDQQPRSGAAAWDRVFRFHRHRPDSRSPPSLSRSGRWTHRSPATATRSRESEIRVRPRARR